MQTVPSVFVQYCRMIKVLMTGRIYDYVESREGDSEVQRTLGRIMAAMKWTLLEIVFIGKEKTEVG